MGRCTRCSSAGPPGRLHSATVAVGVDGDHGEPRRAESRLSKRTYARPLSRDRAGRNAAADRGDRRDAEPGARHRAGDLVGEAKRRRWRDSSTCSEITPAGSTWCQTGNRAARRVLSTITALTWRRSPIHPLFVAATSRGDDEGPGRRNRPDPSCWALLVRYSCRFSSVFASPSAFSASASLAAASAPGVRLVLLGLALLGEVAAAGNRTHGSLACS